VRILKPKAKNETKGIANAFKELANCPEKNLDRACNNFCNENNQTNERFEETVNKTVDVGK